MSEPYARANGRDAGVSTDTCTRSETAWDEREFEALFMAHYDGIFRHVRRITGSAEAAEDLAQETFLRLYRQQFVDGREHNVRAWLYQVATNFAYNALRDRQRRERREDAVSQDALANPTAPDPAEAAVRHSEQETVREVLATLPARQAQLLLLRHAGLSYKELAEALSVAPACVGTLLARAETAFEAAYCSARHATVRGVWYDL